MYLCTADLRKQEGRTEAAFGSSEVFSVWNRRITVKVNQLCIHVVLEVFFLLPSWISTDYHWKCILYVLYLCAVVNVSATLSRGTLFDVESSSLPALRMVETGDSVVATIILFTKAATKFILVENSFLEVAVKGNYLNYSLNCSTDSHNIHSLTTSTSINHCICV